MSASPKAWLFDLDGTLADTANDLIGAVNAMRVDRGLPALDPGPLRCEASNGARGLLGVGLDLHPQDPEFAAAREEFLERYTQALCEHTTLFPDMAELLAELDARQLRWGIVTNKPIGLARPLIAALGLNPGTLLGGDSTARAKPDPGSLWLASAHLALPAAQCWYLGDAPRDIEAGRAAGMRTIACGWGYIDPQEDPQGWGADVYAHEVRALWELLP